MGDISDQDLGAGGRKDPDRSPEPEDAHEDHAIAAGAVLLLLVLALAALVWTLTTG